MSLSNNWPLTTPANDPGRDGQTGSTHADFAEDLFAMTIEYFSGDYVRTGTGIGSLQASAKEYFNGNISSIGWRTGAASHGATPVMYAYDYDNSYQLTGATFGTPNYASGTFTSLGDPYKVQNLAYDPNGNIQSLVRKDGNGENEHNFAQYLYASNKNQLTEIPGYAAYDYNEIGQLTEEILENAGYNDTDITRTLSYDVTGKVTGVRFEGTDEQGSYEKNANYRYDDRGFRVMKRDPDGKETWYIRDAGGNVLATYEKRPGETDLEIKEKMIYGSGRIGVYNHDFVKLDPDKGYITGDEYRNEYEGKDYELLPGARMTLTEGFSFEANGGDFTISTVDSDDILGATLYELNDHLGNVRVAMTQERTSVPFRTNLESPEGGGFMNVETTRRQDANLNHTPGGSWSSWLNPSINGHITGPAITLMVSPGDTVNMKVYGMYTSDTNGDGSVVSGLAAAVAGGLTQTGGLEASQVVDLFSQLLGGVAAVMQGNPDVPKAYLKYILFDRSMEMRQHGHIVLSEAALNNWEALALEVPVNYNGYMYIYVANESNANVDVHFDDMEVTLIEGPAVNGADYYPYGLKINELSWESENYKFGFQGQWAEYDEETSWNYFALRQYDPVVGRWLSVDPYRQFTSPYIGIGNNPIRFIDPDGGKIPDWYVNNKTGQLDHFKGQSGYIEGHTWVAGDEASWSSIRSNVDFLTGNTSALLDEIIVTPTSWENFVDFSVIVKDYSIDETRDMVNTATYLTTAVGSPIINAVGGRDVSWAKVYTFDKNWQWTGRALDNGTLGKEEFKEMLHYTFNGSIMVFTAGFGSIVKTSKPAFNKAADFVIKQSSETIMGEMVDSIIDYH